jgi:hypothetical protein
MTIFILLIFASVVSVKNRIVRPYGIPRVSLLGSKPVLRDRCCDGMIDKRAPLPWVEAQDQPRRGAGENENGGHGAVLSTQTPHKPPDTTTTVSRNHAVICPHPGKKHGTFNTAYHTRNTTTNTTFDKSHMSKVTTKSAGLARRGAGPMHSVRLTLDAARRKGSPQTYRALGRIQRLNSLRGQRPNKATI